MLDFLCYWYAFNKNMILLDEICKFRQKMSLCHTTFSSAFPWMKIHEFRLVFHLKFVPKGQMNNIQALVWIMAWRQAIIWIKDG